nr:unnamed protein product [Spirometra erinaceieuropaei]
MAHKSQMPRFLNSLSQPPPTYPRCQRTSRGSDVLTTRQRQLLSLRSPLLSPHAANPTKTAIPVTDDHIADGPPPSISGTIHSTPTPASIKATNTVLITISRIPPTDGTTSDVL